MKHFVFYTLASILLVPARLLAQDIKIEDLTDNKGKVEWTWRVSVGEVPFDKPVTARFDLKNISSDTLLIKDVQAGCHCTIAEFPKDPIAPGQTATLKATYDAHNEGQFFKTISVLTNFDLHHLVTLSFLGTVKAKHN